MGNHIHLLIVVGDNGEDVKGFCSHFFGEVARTTNRLLGRSGSLWDGRVDVLPVLDVHAAIEKLAYILLNPVAADLIEEAGDYPGLTSIRYSPDHSPQKKLCKWIRSSEVYPLSRAGYSVRAIEEFERFYQTLDTAEYELRIDPLAFLKQLGSDDVTHFRELLETRMRELHTGYSQARHAKQRRAMGKKRLQHANPWTRFRPKKWERKSICITTLPELRQAYRSTYQAFCEQCKDAWNSLKTGARMAIFPPGAFRPSAPMLASVV